MKNKKANSEYLSEVIHRPGFLNKKANSEYLSPFMYIILGMVGLGIVIGVVIFLTTAVDIREEEAKTLSNSILNSIQVKGYIDKRLLEENFSIINNLYINKEFIEDGTHFIKLEISDKEKVLRVYEIGKKDLEVECYLKGGNFPKCYLMRVILIDKEDKTKKYAVKILVASNNKGGNF
jgi:hypothetical protein